MMANNFVECETVEQANNVDLGIYTFIGFRNDAYCFKVRQRK
jgi:hypothetical protein